MLSLLDRFYAWHDQLPEPKRVFMLLVLMIALVIVPVGIGGWLGIALGFAAGLFLMITRVKWLMRKI